MKSKIKVATGEFNFNQVVREVRDANGIVVERDSEKITVPPINIEIETEYAPQEILDYWNITKTVMAEAPEAFKQFVISLANTYTETQTAMNDILGGTENGEQSN